jgi:hypothetical protein
MSTAPITDEVMKDRLSATMPYTLVILHKTEKANDPEAMKIIWEHGRRNFQLREEGVLAIVCPIRDESDVSGVGIFTTDGERTREIMEGDPGVQAGIFTYEVHATRGFPGDALPAPVHDTHTI